MSTEPFVAVIHSLILSKIFKNSIPTYPQCIFSVEAATRLGAKVNFDGDSAMLIANDGNTTFSIQQHGRLYYLCKTYVAEKRSQTLEMWHRLLGHCNIEDVKRQSTLFKV